MYITRGDSPQPTVRSVNCHHRQAGNVKLSHTSSDTSLSTFLHPTPLPTNTCRHRAPLLGELRGTWGLAQPPAPHSKSNRIPPASPVSVFQASQKSKTPPWGAVPAPPTRERGLLPATSLVRTSSSSSWRHTWAS